MKNTLPKGNPRAGRVHELYSREWGAYLRACSSHPQLEEWPAGKGRDADPG